MHSSTDVGRLWMSDYLSVASKSSHTEVEAGSIVNGSRKWNEEYWNECTWSHTRGAIQIRRESPSAEQSRTGTSKRNPLDEQEIRRQVNGNAADPDEQGAAPSGSDSGPNRGGGFTGVVKFPYNMQQRLLSEGVAA